MSYVDQAIVKYADLVAPIGYSIVRQDALLHLDKYSAIAEVKALDKKSKRAAKTECGRGWVMGLNGKCVRPKKQLEAAKAETVKTPSAITPDRVNEIGSKIAAAFKAKGIDPTPLAIMRAIDNHPKLKDLSPEDRAALAKTASGKPPEKPKTATSKDFIDRGDALMPDSLKSAIDAAAPLVARRDEIEKKVRKAHASLKGKPPTPAQKALIKKAIAETKKINESEELAALTNEMKVFRERLIDDSPANDRDALAFAKSFVMDDKIPKDDQVAVRKTAREYYKLVGGAGTNTIKNFTRTSDRAGARPWENSVNVGASANNRAVMMHEMAHHLEYADKSIGSASLDFIQSRATTKDPKMLKEITGNLNYRDNEIAYEDNWVTPYIGKVYEKAGKIIPATEVVSVGIEHFDSAASMAKLAAKDPEHFKFVVGMMRK
jgi:hypothetical protein